MTSFTWDELHKRVIFEDNAVIVLHKPAGISVVGDAREDIIKLAEQAGEKLFPVHRIDKETSGVILFAKNLEIHGKLTRQFNKKTVKKAYIAIVRGKGLPSEGMIDLPLSEGRKNAVRVAAQRENIQYSQENNYWFVNEADVIKSVKTYPSTTKFFKLFGNDTHTVLLVHPLTGRRHQIRVHLAWIGYAIEGDPLFVKESQVTRTLLHSFFLSFTEEWKDNKRVEVKALPEENFWSVIPHTVIAGILEKADTIVTTDIIEQ